LNAEGYGVIRIAMLAESLPALSFRSAGCGIMSRHRLLRTWRF